MNKVKTVQLVYIFTLSILLLLLLDAVPTQLVSLKQTYAKVWSGGDLVVKQPSIHPINIQNQTVSESIKIGTMMLYEDSAYLVHLQLIDQNYPLYGELISDQPGYIEPGTIWIAEEFSKQHNINIGDQVAIGDQVLNVSGYVQKQDEQVFDFEAFSPSVYMRIDESASLGLITETSRLNYYTYIKTDDPMLASYLKNNIRADARLIEPEESLGRIDRVLSQVIDFLWVARLIGYMMAGFLIHLALEFYHHDRAKDIGIMMAMGLGRMRRLRYLSMPIMMSAIYAIILGSLCSLPILYVIDRLVSHMPIQIVLPGFELIKRAVGVFIIMVFSLSLIHISSLLGMSVIRLLRKHPRSINYPLMFLISSVIAMYSVVVSWEIITVTRSILMLVMVLMGIYMVLYVLIQTFMRYLQRGNIRSLLLLNGLRLYQYEYTFVVLFTACLLTLGIFIWHTQTQAISSWQATLPEESSNAFLVGIQPDEVELLKRDFLWLNDTFYPVVKGRLTSINNKTNQTYQEGRFIDHEVFNRQINLTMLDDLPENNAIIEGEWGDEGISAEEGIMDRLGLSLGDKLTFLIYDDVVTLPITSIRKVEWQSMRANFYFMFPMNAISQYPASYLTNAFLASNKRGDLTLLQQKYPGVAFLDIAMFIEQAQSLLSQIIYLATSVLVVMAIFGCAAFVQIISRQSGQKKQQSIFMAKLGISPMKYPVIKDELYFIMLLSSCIALTCGVAGIHYINTIITAKWYFDVTSLFMLLVPWGLTAVYVKLLENVMERT